jgi:hypothetical protein
MPHYFFDVKNGHRLIDPAGVDCANDDHAKRQAALIADQIAMDLPQRTARRVVAVLDENGREVATVEIPERSVSE